MKYIRYLAIAVGLVVFGALALPALITRAQTPATSLKVVEHADTDTVTDTGTKCDTVGDILTFANKVFDQDNKKETGSDNGYCFRTVVGAAWECAWTVTLSDGQIMVQGPFYDTKDSTLAIIGGTGAYSNTRGDMLLHSRNDKGTEYDFTYNFAK